MWPVFAILLLAPVSRSATLGYWRFEEGPADFLVYNRPTHSSADSSGSGNHGYSFSLANSASFSDLIPSSVIPLTGAANSIYTLGSAGTTDHGARFRVVVSNVSAGQTNTVASSEALPAVLADQTPPALLGAQWLGDPQSVVVTFSEPVESASALPTANYTLGGGVSVLGPWAQTNGLPNDAGTIRLRNRLDAALLEVNYSDDEPGNRTQLERAADCPAHAGAQPQVARPCGSLTCGNDA